MGINEKNEKRMSRFNKVLAATVAATVGIGGAMLYNKNETPARAVTHDNDTFILHLKDGKTLDDVDALSSSDLSYLKNNAQRVFDVESQLGTDLDDTYLINPSSKDDARLHDIIQRVKKDAQNDVVDAEYNITLSLNLPEDQVYSVSTDKDQCYSLDNLCDKMWGMDALNAKEAHAYLKTVTPKKKAKVYVLDTGISSHEDLEGVLKKEAKDGHGHGTHCAGTIGATSNNRKGVFSMDPEGKFVELYGIKVLSDSGSGSLNGIANGIVKATDEGADVISMSLGGYSPNPPSVMKKAVDYALSKNVIVVVAAGNDNDNAKNYTPANIPGVITVAAVGEDGSSVKRAHFSNYGDIVDIAAPGMVIWSTVPKNNRMQKGNDYIAIQGTSMATPHVAGMAGIERALEPSLTAQEFLRYNTAENTSHMPKTEKNKNIGRFPDFYAGLKNMMSDKQDLGYSIEPMHVPNYFTFGFE